METNQGVPSAHSLRGLWGGSAPEAPPRGPDSGLLPEALRGTFPRACLSPSTLPLPARTPAARHWGLTLTTSIKTLSPNRVTCNAGVGGLGLQWMIWGQSLTQGHPGGVWGSDWPSRPSGTAGGESPLLTSHCALPLQPVTYGRNRGHLLNQTSAGEAAWQPDKPRDPKCPRRTAGNQNFLTRSESW